MQDDGLLPVISARGGEDGGEEDQQQLTPNGAPQARTLVHSLSGKGARRAVCGC